MEAVAEGEIGPAVDNGDGVVHLDVEVAEAGDVGGGFLGVVETVVGGCEAFLAGLHDGLAVGVVGLAD